MAYISTCQSLGLVFGKLSSQVRRVEDLTGISVHSTTYAVGVAVLVHLPEYRFAGYFT